ncbi:MAG: ABC transporter ATP-binding protein [Sulfobacillus acidophilus]|uniref:ABC transporter ATP-binding protein n=1 Tax=Sulfobacillus acidophilus TaxID=53633 RepID=A0A2T2WD74_9FIRM|nr:MAG: ABC transporter ATP-binding protein [Sulfobacillus acidophilus]
MIQVLAYLGARSGGEITLGGEPVPVRLNAAALDRLRQLIVLRDLFGVLNPHYLVEYLLKRPIFNYCIQTQEPILELIVKTVETVELSPYRDFMGKYPNELSRGQRQRVVIVRALVTQPEVILADGPTSMLDVFIRMSILDLLEKLQAERHLSYLFITHDLASTRYISDHLLVMYAGHAVEGGETGEVVQHPLHPYTQLLLSAVPRPGRPDPIGVIASSAEPPNLSTGCQGCVFQSRCPLAMARCTTEIPQAQEVGSDHWMACHAISSA